MKKQLLLFVFSLLSCTGFAQNNFAPIGAEWYYLDNSYNDVMGPDQRVDTWLDKVLVEKDTVWQGVDCKKMTVTRMMKEFDNPQVITEAPVSLFTYNSGDTTFMFNNYTNTFEPLYIFNRNVGDTICTSTFGEPDFSYPDSNFCYVIDSIKIVAYGSNWLKTYYTTAIVNDGFERTYNFGMNNNRSDGWKHFGTFTEMLGGSVEATGMLPILLSTVFDHHGTTPRTPSGAIQCYTDSTISYKSTSLPCDSFLGRVAIADRYANTLDLHFYPNPTIDEITFSTSAVFNEATAVSIFDISGRLVLTADIPKHTKLWTLHLPRLNKGMYLLKATNGSGLLRQKLLIE